MKAQKSIKTFVWCWYDNFTGSIISTFCLCVFTLIFFQIINTDDKKDFLFIYTPIFLWWCLSLQSYTLDRLNSKIATEWTKLQKLSGERASWLDDLELNRYLFHETRESGIFRKKLSSELIESYNRVFSKNREEREKLEEKMQKCLNIIWMLKVVCAIFTGKWKRTSNTKRISKKAEGYTLKELLK